MKTKSIFTFCSHALRFPVAPWLCQFLLVWLAAGSLLLTGCKKDNEVTPAVTANAGPDQQVQVGQTVTLDGSASASGGTFAWTLVRKPASSTVTLAGAATARPTFKPDQTGEYELQLTVTTPEGTGTDRVLVTTATAEPLAITANITVKTNLIDRIANPDLPDYVVTKSIDVTHELTIAPGVVIAFERDVRLNINDGGGLLIAKGEAGRKIKFVGVQKTKGFWTGIALYSASNANLLEHVEMMHAGSRPLYSTTKAALYMSGGSKAQISLKNCLFSQNDGYGVYVYEGGILREFAQNTFSQHTEAGILLDAANVARLDAASSFTGGNGRNAVEITASDLSGAGETVWAGFADNSPYLINGEFTINTGFKLMPGVIMAMHRDAVIRVNASGYLDATGTAAAKVVFTGNSNAAAFWRGIICYSQDNRNVLEHAEVKNAGSIAIVSGKKANVAVYGTKANLIIKNTRISGSGGYGVFVSYSATTNADLPTANTFESNAQANVLVEK